jgi:uncharacterized protein (TIGR00255 family)
MILSMTGFGKAVVTLPNKKITVEIKSLNSKQLDLAVRIPSIYREKELELRNLVSKRLERGKVDMNIFIENISCETPTSLNVPALAAYKEQILNACQELNIPQPADWYSILLRFPDTLHSEQPTEVDESESQALEAAVNEAVEALMQYRGVEGAKLETFFKTRIEAITELLAEVPKYEAERIAKIRSRIAEGLAKISQVDYDRARLEQEMIFYIEKLDVNEEKQRLAQHLTYFIETLTAPTPGQGKKLGFISQEMGREINTLGSKSNHAEMQKIVVKMKDNLEQIKEQVLNVM